MSIARSDKLLSALSQILAGDHDSFGTFSIAGDDGRWVQYMPGVINAAYPFADDPNQRLAAFPDFAVVEWDAGTSVTGDLNRLTSETIAEWIEKYFVEILQSPATVDLNIALQL